MVQTIYIDPNTGNLGIGTATPLKPLHIQGDSIITGNVGIGTATPLQPLHIQGGSIITGNVGIGTTNPLAALHVEGDIKITRRLGTGFSTVALVLNTKYYGPASIIGTSVNLLSTGHKSTYAEMGQDTPTEISTGIIEICKTRADPTYIVSPINIYIPPGYWCRITRQDSNVTVACTVIYYY